jgi:hypothetical protein
MVICTRCRYKRRPDHGLIRVTRFVDKNPVEYTLQLYKENIGFLKTNKKKFQTIADAKGHASLYGYSLAFWESEERDV